MSTGSASGGGSTRSNDVVSSIIIIIIVTLVTTTSLNYSGFLAARSPSSVPTTSTTLSTSLTSSLSTTTSSTTLRSSTASTTASTSTTISSTTTSSTGTSAWSQFSSYPIDVWLPSCVVSGAEVYCVGGETGSDQQPTDAVYSTSLLPGVSSGWVNYTSYPVAVRSESCVASGNTIYCIGGFNSTSAMANVYFTSILPTGGNGHWASTTSYPIPVGTQSCVASTRGIYCIGGSTARASISTVYFAPFLFTAPGLGQWTNTTSYPVTVKQQSCIANADDVFCVGGFESKAVYFAPITSSGLGTWTATTSYLLPTAANLLSCADTNVTAYCVGGQSSSLIYDGLYEAPLSSSGVGQWTAGSGYPFGVVGESCVVYGTTLYCIGGETASGPITDEVWSTMV